MLKLSSVQYLDIALLEDIKTAEDKYFPRKPIGVNELAEECEKLVHQAEMNDGKLQIISPLIIYLSKKKKRHLLCGNVTGQALKILYRRSKSNLLDTEIEFLPIPYCLVLSPEDLLLYTSFQFQQNEFPSFDYLKLAEIVEKCYNIKYTKNVGENKKQHQLAKGLTSRELIQFLGKRSQSFMSTLALLRSSSSFVKGLLSQDLIAPTTVVSITYRYKQLIKQQHFRYTLEQVFEKLFQLATEEYQSKRIEPFHAKIFFDSLTKEIFNSSFNSPSKDDNFFSDDLLLVPSFERKITSLVVLQQVKQAVYSLDEDSFDRLSPSELDELTSDIRDLYIRLLRRKSDMEYYVLNKSEN